MIFPVENVFVCLSRAWQEQKGQCAGRTADRLTSCLQRFGVGLVSRGNWHCMVPLRKVLLSEPSATQTRTNELREMGRNETQHSMQVRHTCHTCCSNALCGTGGCWLARPDWRTGAHNLFVGLHTLNGCEPTVLLDAEPCKSTDR